MSRLIIVRSTEPIAFVNRTLRNNPDVQHQKTMETYNTKRVGRNVKSSRDNQAVLTT